MRSIILVLTALALTAPKALAAGDPYADISTMRVAFSHVRSVVAVQRYSSGELATVEYASPNRYHVTMHASQIVLAGNVEYDRKAGSAWKRSSNGAQHQALLSAAWNIAGPTNIDVHKLFTITSLGSKKIEGTTLRGYLLHDAAGAYDATVWIGPTYLPIYASIQMPDQTIKVHYIAYNTSVDVAMPQLQPAVGTSTLGERSP
ncbi:MAG TPA: hypothetical protein VHX17_08965 [Candidatus Cybelea sp.]|jgi:hypothetical protein|nr:hypothetical protein [Candidatus Cybelea sp.]